MRISRIKIENHSRLADFEIQVREHLILVGANEVGKSSLLRCLDLLLDAGAAKLYTNISTADFRDESQPFVVEADLEEFSDGDRALYPDEIQIDPATGSELLTVRLSAVLDATEALVIQRNAPSGGTNRQLSRDQVLGLGWKFLSAASQSRELREDRRSALNEILEAVDNLRSDLADQLSKALPEPIAKNDLALVPGAAADNDVLSDVRLQISKAGIARDLSEQSDGMKALFAIAFYDLYSGGANVFGIDEPEEHLHPTSQRSLARLLKDRPNQKVIATHSSDIVSAFDPDTVVVIRRGGEVVQPTAGFLSSEEKLAVSWWVRGRLEPLTSRRVIVVEGLSDRIIVERAADLTGRNLDRLGVSLVDAGGKNSIPAVEKLFGRSGFDVPLFQLVDEDFEADTARRLGITIADLAQQSVWVSRPDLEDEYVRAVGAPTVWSALSASSMFSRNQLSNCLPTGPSGTYTDADVATFCRGHKVEAAIVVANLLTDAFARSIASLGTRRNPDGHSYAQPVGDS